MTEPDVTLTDYALMALCLAFVRNLAYRNFKLSELKNLWLVFFTSVALASLTGGTVHGFFLDEASIGYKVLWPTTLLSIGVTASSAWVLAGLFIFSQRALKVLLLLGAISFAIYGIIVLGFSQSFTVVVFNYLPPMVILFLASLKEYRRTRATAFVWIAIGIGISFFAAYIQQAQVAIHPLYFNHNSTYHLLQGFGLSALYYGAKNLQDKELCP